MTELNPNPEEVNQVLVAALASPANAGSPKLRASISCGAEDIPEELARSLKRIETILEAEVWLLLQGVGDESSELSDEVYEGFFRERNSIVESKPIVLIVESPGGQAAAAHRIARLFQRRTSEFWIIVPRYAKSAATLLALGAKRLILGRDAELGPLDVQMFDMEREEFGSALNAVQSLERLNAFALTAVDQMTPLLMRRTGRKLDTILPLVLDYAVSFVKPLLNKIDTVEFTKKARELKVAEEYASRLLRSNHSLLPARRIANHLVDQYPTHGFVIDLDEAKDLGLNAEKADAEIQGCIDTIIPFLDRITLVGKLIEVKGESS